MKPLRLVMNEKEKQEHDAGNVRQVEIMKAWIAKRAMLRDFDNTLVNNSAVIKLNNSGVHRDEIATGTPTDA